VHRIFPYLLLCAAVLLAAAMALGFQVDVLARDASALTWRRVHFQAGLTAAVAVMFVNAVVLTYFIGTSRWCREVSEAYSLPPDCSRSSQRLKRRAFPFTLGNMLLMVGLAALGAAADTRPLPDREGITWAELHLVGVLTGVALLALASYFQWVHIRANQAIITQILDQVRTIRTTKGLD